MIRTAKCFGLAGAVLSLGALSILPYSHLSAQSTRITGQIAACKAGKTIDVEISKSEGSSTLIISAKVGDRVRVTLPGQAGTGFQWFMTLREKSLVATPGMTAPTPKGGKPGGPSKAVFSVLMTAAGTQNLYFRYLRPWETGKPAAREAAVRVRIADC